MRIGLPVLYTMTDGENVRPAFIVAIREEWTAASKSDPRFTLKGVAPFRKGIEHAKKAVLEKASKLGAFPPADLETTSKPLSEVDLSVLLAGREDRGHVEHHEREAHGSSEAHPNVIHRRAKMGLPGEAGTWFVEAEPPTLPTGATPAPAGTSEPTPPAAPAPAIVVPVTTNVPVAAPSTEDGVPGLGPNPFKAPEHGATSP